MNCIGWYVHPGVVQALMVRKRASTKAHWQSPTQVRSNQPGRKMASVPRSGKPWKGTKNQAKRYFKDQNRPVSLASQGGVVAKIIIRILLVPTWIVTIVDPPKRSDICPAVSFGAMEHTTWERMGSVGAGQIQSTVRISNPAAGTYIQSGIMLKTFPQSGIMLKTFSKASSFRLPIRDNGNLVDITPFLLRTLC